MIAKDAMEAWIKETVQYCGAECVSTFSNPSP